MFEPHFIKHFDADDDAAKELADMWFEEKADLDRVYANPCKGFGDSWSGTGMLLDLSEKLGKPLRVSSKDTTRPNTVNEIQSYFDSTGKIQLVNERCQVKTNFWQIHKHRIVPTKVQWSASKSRVVCCQFDGIHLSHHKNPKPWQVKLITDTLCRDGFMPINLGGMKPIKYIIDNLARARFFIGCPSGIAHVAMSVGTPMKILTFNMTDREIHNLKRDIYWKVDKAAFFRLPQQFFKDESYESCLIPFL
jgi:hypothetical protein